MDGLPHSGSIGLEFSPRRNTGGEVSILPICAECCCHDFISVQGALDKHDGDVVSVHPTTCMIPETAVLI
jgi:hypothetical protein